MRIVKYPKKFIVGCYNFILLPIRKKLTFLLHIKQNLFYKIKIGNYITRSKILAIIFRIEFSFFVFEHIPKFLFLMTTIEWIVQPTKQFTKIADKSIFGASFPQFYRWVYLWPWSNVKNNPLILISCSLPIILFCWWL